ncbi:SHOCT domain-containing protein [Limnohabitans sp.]|uniref:SHOCT domain-containing protein n=1 Tax=Limnohabitans sp. TaxID=1907725 RepID=UPI0038BB8D67
MTPIRNLALITFSLSVLIGCAAPDAVMISPGVYMISRTSAAGSVFANMAQLKADTIDAANQFAQSKGKEAIAVSIRDERPIPGFPLVEYQFRLAEPGSVRDSSVIMKKDADITIRRDENISIKTEQAAPKGASQDLYAELVKLEDLKKRGLLSEEEFQEQKRKLLNK